MSQSVELVLESVRRFTVGDFPGLASFYTPNVVVVAPPGWPEAGRFEGRDCGDPTADEGAGALGPPDDGGPEGERGTRLGRRGNPMDRARSGKRDSRPETVIAA